MGKIKGFKSQYFDGLPAFFGGKRKMVKFILSLTNSPRFTDLFFGGGSVSLYAKLQNRQVTANDIAPISIYIAKGIVQNNGLKVNEWDIKRLLFAPDAPKFIQKHYPRLFPPRFARFIDNAVYFIHNRLHSEQKKNLLLAYIINFILYIRPFSNLTTTLHSKFGRTFDEKEVPFDARPDGTLIKYTKSVREIAYAVAKRVNNSIFPGKKPVSIYQKDAFDFLKTYQPGPDETIYLDPPYYKAGQYDILYSRLDEIIHQKKRKPATSPFADVVSALIYLRNLIADCHKFKHLILSYRAEGLTAEDILYEVKKSRKDLKVYKVPYNYTIGVGGGTGKQKLVEEVVICG